ncbi:glycosyltransferase family 2 protein [Pseudoalteromonas rhizosphaerae]|uniref:glycosyltransferase family 2 protein n=1 Tax=Pseudoalteromonas rhizosphaerae TaxID=2518973 RepID=UPI002148722C|nr:glycosyltransferase family A protein [Pseudoalteromonas rhizosphaerae]
MKISVVIPLFNKEQYIERCLKSIQAQTYQNFEIIVIDDGSTDQGAELVRALGLSKLRLISQPNGGVSKARNHGIDKANGEWIAFIDADDYWKPDFLLEMINLIEKFPYVSLCCSAYSFKSRAGVKLARICVPGEGKYRLIDNYFYSTCRGNLPVTASSVVIKKVVLETIGGFPVGWKMGEDIFVWIYISISYQLAICMKNLAVYDESDSGSATKVNQVLEVLPHVKSLEEWIRSGQVSSKQVRDAKELVHRSYIFTALQNLKLGKKKESRRIIQSDGVRFGLHYIAVLLLSLLPSKLLCWLFRESN